MLQQEIPVHERPHDERPSVVVKAERRLDGAGERRIRCPVFLLQLRSCWLLRQSQAARREVSFKSRYNSEGSYRWACTQREHKNVPGIDKFDSS